MIVLCMHSVHGYDVIFVLKLTEELSFASNFYTSFHIISMSKKIYVD